MGQFKAAKPVRDGSGEGALSVTKKLALQKLFGNGCTVDGNEIGARAHGLFVQRPGQEFFAGAALSRDQHRGVGVGNGAKQVSEGLCGVALANELRARFHNHEK